MTFETATFTAQMPGIRGAIIATEKIAKVNAGARADGSVLGAVHYRREGNALVFTATDRYRLVRATVVGQWSDESPESLEGLLCHDACKSIIATIRATVTGLSDISFQKDERGEVIIDIRTLNGNRMTAIAHDGGYPTPKDFPRLESIIAPKEPSLVAGFAVNAAFMADVASIHLKTAPKRAPLELLMAGNALRADWENESGGVSYVALLMPVKSDAVEYATEAAKRAARLTGVSDAG